MFHANVHFILHHDARAFATVDHCKMFMISILWSIWKFCILILFTLNLSFWHNAESGFGRWFDDDQLCTGKCYRFHKTVHESWHKHFI